MNISETSKLGLSSVVLLVIHRNNFLLVVHASDALKILDLT
jgi:hypothetical protein